MDLNPGVIYSEHVFLINFVYWVFCLKKRVISNNRIELFKNSFIRTQRHE